MLTKDQNIALLTVGNAALKNPDWINYANYCFEREKGLRKKSFESLIDFIKSTNNWTFDEKVNFIKFLFPFFENLKSADYGPFPQPLSEQLIKPTLINWCKIETSNGNPFRWYGKYYHSQKHLLKALEINPKDDLARQTVLNLWIDKIYYSTHHLPQGYIGEPSNDIILANQIKEQIAQFTTSNLRNEYTKRLEKYLKLIENYIEWKTSGHSNFEKWGLENNKQTSYDLVKTYNYKNTNTKPGL